MSSAPADLRLRVPAAPDTSKRAAIRYGGKVYASIPGSDHADVARAMRAARAVLPTEGPINTETTRGWIVGGEFVLG